MAKMFDSYRSRLEPKLPSYLPLEEFKKSGFDLDKMRLLGKKLAISDAEYVFAKIKNFPKNGLTPVQSITMKNMLLEFDLLEEGIVVRNPKEDVFVDLYNRRLEAFEKWKAEIEKFEAMTNQIIFGRRDTEKSSLEIIN